MKPKVYIETSIPSFYHEIRIEPEMVARRQWTQEWQENAQDNYVLVTSVAVLDELNQGNFPIKKDAIELLNDLPLLPIEEAITDIVQAYIQHQVMPGILLIPH